MEPIPNEHVITQTNDGIVVLTNFRVRYSIRYTSWVLKIAGMIGGFSESENIDSSRNATTIMLEKITSIQFRFWNFPWILVFAVLSAIIAIGGPINRLINDTDRATNNPEELLYFFVAFALLALFLYWLYKWLRTHIISIHTANGSIRFWIRNMTHAQVEAFVDTIEEAKYYRVQAMHNNVVSTSAMPQAANVGVSGVVVCPACKTTNQQGDLYCQNCGSQL